MTNLSDLLSVLSSGGSVDFSTSIAAVSIGYSDVANAFVKFEHSLSEEKRELWESTDSIKYDCYGAIETMSMRAAFSRIVRNISYPTGWMVEGRPLPKFFAHEYYKTYHANLPEWVKSSFGGIVGKLNRIVNLEMRLAPVVDWESGDFGDSGSCYWGGREDARPAILNAGGGSLRIWDTDSGAGIGRAWYLPANDGLVMWNSYGPYDLLILGSYLERAFGCEASAINLLNQGKPHGTVWINNGSGIHITDPGCPRHPSTVDLGIDVRTRVKCENCRTLGYASDMTSDANDRLYCETCARELVYCERCGDAFWPSDDRSIVDAESGDILWYCSSSCRRSDGWRQCDYCGDYRRYDRNSDTLTIVSKYGVWGHTKYYCNTDCAHSDGCRPCEDCNHLAIGTNTIDGLVYCDTCYEQACTRSD